MFQRVTQSLASQTSRQRVQQSYSQLYASQLRVSRGKRISTPSDDPAAISRLLFFRERLGELKQYQSNAVESRAFVDSAAANLQEASDLVQRARETVVQGLNGSLGQTDRDTIAIALDGFIQDLVALSNSKVGNRFVFGGTRTDQPPFELTTDGSGQSRINYRGNFDRINTEIAPGVTSDINLPGLEVFGQGKRGQTIFSGVTGARAGLGTDNATGIDQLIITHGTTTLAGTSGVAVGASSSSDTIIGQHSLQIDDVNKTISFAGGTPVTYTGAETDLALTGPNGAVIHLDMTGVTPGFVGSDTANASGFASIDGGATSVQLDFSTNQQLVDSYSGQVINIDSSGITRTGSDDVRMTGTLDLFQALIAIRDGLREVDQKPDKIAAIDFIRGQLDELDSGHEQLLQSLGELGSISQRLEGAENRVQDLDVRLQEVISKTEDVDISQAIIDLQQSEAAYQSALLVTSRIGDISLLNYL